MNRKSAAWSFALAIALILWDTNLDRPALAQNADTLVMVVNTANTSVIEINKGDARKLLIGETSDWRTGMKVLVVLKPAGDPDRVAVLKKICGMTETIYTRYELQASFTGGTVATINVAATDAAVKATVRANPGAVGFLHKNEVDASVKAVLTLD